MIEIEIGKATHHHLLSTWLINLAFLRVWSFGEARRECSGMKLTLLSSACIWKCWARALQLILIPCQKHNIDCNGKAWQRLGGANLLKLSFGTCKSASPHYWLRWGYWGYLLGPVITYFSFDMKAAFCTTSIMPYIFCTQKEGHVCSGSGRVTCLKPFYVMMEYMHL